MTATARLALAIVALVAAGCGTGRDTEGVAWSTKTPPATTPAPAPATEVAATPLHVAEPRLDPATDPLDDLRFASIDLLLQASESRMPLLRANAIEALHQAPAALERVVQATLADENRGVRFAAAMTVGTERLVRLAPLVEPLLHDESDSVRAAAIYALRRCGRTVDLDPLGHMIMSEDPEVKANAAIVLGKLGNRTATPMLWAAARQRPERVSAARAKIVELQIAEALVKLGEGKEIEAIRAALFSPTGQGEIRAFAAVILGRLRDEAYVGTLRDMAVRQGERQEAAEVRMAATMAVARINPAAAPIDVPLTYARHERPEIRAQAALTLGAIGDRDALGPLQTLLVDEDPLVQVAAAGGILEILASGDVLGGNQSRD